MSRRSSYNFKRYWHRRELEHHGRVLTWILIDDPRSPRPHAECFRWLNGSGLHFDEGRRILAEHGHPDLEHVPTDGIGAGRFH